MTDHYETLGIPKDADAAAIKCAWKRAASKAHPDRAGGDTAKMAAVNRALEVLGDPERREQYDRSGNDARVQTIADEARGMLIAAFDRAIDSAAPNLVAHVRGQVASQKREVSTFAEQMRQKAKAVGRYVGKVKCKAPDDLVRSLINQKLKQVEEGLAKVARAQLLHAEVEKQLALYEQPEEERPPDLLGELLRNGGAGSLYGSPFTKVYP